MRDVIAAEKKEKRLYKRKRNYPVKRHRGEPGLPGSVTSCCGIEMPSFRCRAPIQNLQNSQRPFSVSGLIRNYRQAARACVRAPRAR